MIRITATGNNFGAGDIIFTAFVDSNLLILNAEVTFDPSNPAYRAVSGLEIYVPRNLKGPVTRLKWNIADTTDITGGTASNGQTYWTATDEWVFLGIALSRLEQADAGTQVSFKIRGLPEMEDFDGILMDDQAISPSVGTRMLRFHIRDNVFTVEPIHPDRNWHYMQYCGFICYVPRKRVADE